MTVSDTTLSRMTRRLTRMSSLVLLLVLGATCLRAQWDTLEGWNYEKAYDQNYDFWATGDQIIALASGIGRAPDMVELVACIATTKNGVGADNICGISYGESIELRRPSYLLGDREFSSMRLRLVVTSYDATNISFQIWGSRVNNVGNGAEYWLNGSAQSTLTSPSYTLLRTATIARSVGIHFWSSSYTHIGYPYTRLGHCTLRTKEGSGGGVAPTGYLIPDGRDLNVLFRARGSSSPGAATGMTVNGTDLSELFAAGSSGVTTNYDVNGNDLKNLFAGPYSPSAYGNREVFNYTEDVQNWTVPPGVTTIRIKVWGAGGGPGYPLSLGEWGGFAQMDFNVTPGQVLTIYVGGAGSYNSGGGWFGGGNAGYASGGGGGKTQVTGSGIYVVAGGGGGGGVWGTFDGDLSGGNGGGSAGLDGNGREGEINGGGGAQPDRVGWGGWGLVGYGENGDGGTGGAGHVDGGGGGGGGHYGGGGGGNNSAGAGGGGGSGYFSGGWGGSFTQSGANDNPGGAGGGAYYMPVQSSGTPGRVVIRY